MISRLTLQAVLALWKEIFDRVRLTPPVIRARLDLDGSYTWNHGKNDVMSDFLLRSNDTHDDVLDF